MYEVGDLVYIQNINSIPYLNGAMAEVVRFDQESGRICVRAAPSPLTRRRRCEPRFVAKSILRWAEAARNNRGPTICVRPHCLAAERISFTRGPLTVRTIYKPDWPFPNNPDMSSESLLHLYACTSYSHEEHILHEQAYHYTGDNVSRLIVTDFPVVLGNIPDQNSVFDYRLVKALADSSVSLNVKTILVPTGTGLQSKQLCKWAVLAIAQAHASNALYVALRNSNNLQAYTLLQAISLHGDDVCNAMKRGSPRVVCRAADAVVLFRNNCMVFANAQSTIEECVRKVEQTVRDDLQENCPVCQQPVASGGPCRFLPCACMLNVHARCLKTLLRTASGGIVRCPQCREEIDPLTAT